MASFTPLDYFFLLCALLGALLFFLRLGVSFFGGEAPDFDPRPYNHAFPDVRHLGEGRLPVFTQQSLTAFLAVFGLVSLLLSRAALPLLWSVLGGILLGVAAMLLVAWLYLSAQRVRSDGMLRIENTISKEGSVTLAIPPEGRGQVNLTVRGALRQFEAVSAGSRSIPVGARVRVLRVAPGRVLVVEPIE